MSVVAERIDAHTAAVLQVLALLFDMKIERFFDCLHTVADAAQSAATIAKAQVGCGRSHSYSLRACALHAMLAHHCHYCYMSACGTVLLLHLRAAV